MIDRPYVVEEEGVPQKRLVIAKSPAQVLRHCAKKFKVRAAKANDIRELVRAGVVEETAGADTLLAGEGEAPAGNGNKPGEPLSPEAESLRKAVKTPPRPLQPGETLETGIADPGRNPAQPQQPSQ